MLGLLLVGCATSAENVAEATGPAVTTSTTAPSETATTVSSPVVEAIEPTRDTLVQSRDEHVDETDEDAKPTRDQQETQVTQEAAPTSEPEPSQEPRPSIKAGSRVTWADAAALPEWPFEGLVQLAWTSEPWGERERWQLRYYQWTDSGVGRGWTVGEVPLPDLPIDCVGDVGLISHGPDGIEVGGPTGSVSTSYLLPWGGTPQRLDTPSDELLAEIRSRPSNVDVEVSGDILSLSHEDASVRFALREPTRSEGDW